MKYDLTVFQEPRGVMRIFQFIFAVCALYTTVNFESEVTFECRTAKTKTLNIDYPFRFGENVCPKNPPQGSPAGTNSTLFLSADVSSDAQFFVATGALSILYCIFIVAVYTIIDEIYKSKAEIPLADFMLTTILAIFWLAGSAAWSNGAGALKSITDAETLAKVCLGCKVTTSSFSRLNTSLLLGYLNFFLWGSDLWFLYKETIWFQARQPGGGLAPGSLGGPNI